jgi:hypothetical protein
MRAAVCLPAAAGTGQRESVAARAALLAPPRASAGATRPARGAAAAAPRSAGACQAWRASARARRGALAASAAPRAADADAADGAAASFAEALLLELGVPAPRVAGTLAAARALHGAPPSERPLLALTAEASALPASGLGGADGDGDGTSGAPSGGAPGVPPFASSLPAVRDAWAAALRAHVAFLRDAGLSAEEAGALLPAFPLALLLPRDGLRPAADFLAALGLSPPELARVLRAAPRLLGFEPAEHLTPVLSYLADCGMAPPVQLALLRAQPGLWLNAVDHDVRARRASKAIAAAYVMQTQERAAWAADAASAARSTLTKRGY